MKSCSDAAHGAREAFHPRRLLRLLRSRLATRLITVLTGARQTGKTTIVRDLLPAAGGGDNVYFSLDDPDERLRLAADPVRRLDHGRVADLDQFALAQNLLAARTARLLSHSEVARELGVAVNTGKRHLRFLELSYQVVLLRPPLPTVTARLVKSPKLYWTDPALARLLGEHGGAPNGALFETAILDELLRWSSWHTQPPALHFFRTHAGREADFVLHAPDRLVAIEAKSARHAHRVDARPQTGVLAMLATRGHARHLGLVVTRGREVEPLAPGVWAVPDWRLFGPAG